MKKILTYINIFVSSFIFLIFLPYAFLLFIILNNRNELYISGIFNKYLVQAYNIDQSNGINSSILDSLLISFIITFFIFLINLAILEVKIRVKK